jgi:acetyltransferase-like isoleucine patch superfamily enzyme
MSENGKIRRGAVGASRVEIGRYTYGFESMSVKQWGEGANLKIGSFCSIAEGLIVILGGNHRVDWITTFPFGHIFQEELGGSGIKGHPVTKGDVIIGSDVWIGRNVTIMSGVNIGDGAVVAANSTVVKDIGSYEIWGGNPARMLKVRFGKEIVEELLSLCWWNLGVDAIKRIAPLISQSPSIENLRSLRESVSLMDRA